MNLDEIQNRVLSGQRVFWVHSGYEVIHDTIGQWLIKCHMNDSCIGLFWVDPRTGETNMNGDEEQFIAGPMIAESDPRKDNDDDRCPTCGALPRL